jgi:quinol-cytochrome oxidoreductase complex cytochrome b subunit
MKNGIILKSLFVVLAVTGLFIIANVAKQSQHITGLFVIASVAKQSQPTIEAKNIAFAADYDMNQAAQDLAQGSLIKEPRDIFVILAKVVRYAYTIFFIVAVLFILVAAFNFLTAQGEPDKIKKARAQITWALVAIAIALISVNAAQIIKTFLTPSAP